MSKIHLYVRTNHVGNSEEKEAEEKKRNNIHLFFLSFSSQVDKYEVCIRPETIVPGPHFSIYDSLRLHLFDLGSLLSIFRKYVYYGTRKRRTYAIIVYDKRNIP
jgi:hypothetical protein